MFEFVCQVCGAQPGANDIQCPNCGSKVSFEHGNPHNGQPVFQKKLVQIGAAAVTLAVIVNAFTISVAGAQVGAMFTSAVGGATSLFGGSSLDALGTESLTDPYGDADTSLGDDTATDDTATEVTDDEGTDSGSDSSGDNTYQLSASQRADGFEEFESSGIAWRWATASEKSNLSCASWATTCTWIKVIALRDCFSVLINADISTDSQTDTASETAVGYGNDDIDNAGMYAGEKGFIELDGSGSYPNGSWMFMTYANCSQESIGHD